MRASGPGKDIDLAPSTSAAPVAPTATKRRRLRLLLGLLGPLALVFVVPFPAGTPALPDLVSGRMAFESESTGRLLAGAAEVELTPEPGGPIAGYPAPRRALGPGARMAARALVLHAGDLQLAVVSLPVLLISPDLEERVLQLSNLGPRACLLLAATHTHSGPGGYWQSPLGVIGATGAFSAERRDALASAAVQAMAQARAQTRPARLAVAQADWAQGPASPRGPHVLDPALSAVQALDAAGRSIGVLAIYGMHPTVIPRSQRTLSGDWPEAAARALEQAGSGPALVLQGAGGDATWPRGGSSGLVDSLREGLGSGASMGPALTSDEAEAHRLGAKVALRTLALLSGKLPSALAGSEAAGAPSRDADETLLPVRLACSVKLVALPAPEGGRSLVYPLRTAATNLLRLLAPRAALQTTLDLPGLRLVGVPGEPVGELGPLARAGSAVPLAVVGLADGYAGYAETRARAALGEGESSRTWYGPGLAAALGLEPRDPSELVEPAKR